MWLLLPFAAASLTLGATFAYALSAEGSPVVPAAWLACGIGVIAARRSPPVMSAAVLALAFVSGGWLAVGHVPSPGPMPTGTREMLVSVESVRPVVDSGRSTVRLLAHRASPDARWTPDGRRFVCRHEIRSEIPLRGDLYYLRGRLQDLGRSLHPFAFDPAAWARSRHITGRLEPATELGLVRAGAGAANRIDRLRVRIERSILSRASEEGAGVLVAIATGSRGALDPEVTARFSANGAAHVLAVSGLHLGLLCVFAFGVLRRAFANLTAITWRFAADRIAALVVAPGVVAYVVLTGAPASAVRAGTMALVMLTGIALGRRPSGIHALAFTVLAMVIWEPAWLMDIGFQLSVSATTALIVAARVAGRHARPSGPIGKLGAAVRVSTVASVATAPVLLWHFGRVPLASPITNLVVVPPIALVALPGALAGGLLDAARLPGAGPLITIADLAALCGLAIARVGGSVLEIPLTWGRPDPPALVGWCALAVASPWIGVARPRAHAAVALVAATLLALGAPHAWVGGTMRLHAIPVGQGDANLLELPDGTRFLIDAGGSAFAHRSTAETSVLPYLNGVGVGRVDIVVVSHSDFDHAGGVPDAVVALRPREVWLPPERGRAALRRVARAAVSVGATVRTLDMPHAMVSGGARVVAVADSSFPSANDGSVVVRACHGQTCFLLAGDIEAEREAALLAAGAPLSAQVLKVPHHGSPTSSTAEFIDRVAPRVAILEIGEGNRFGFPDADVVRRYRDRAIRMRRTDRGPVVVEADGELVYVVR